jgi:hypothetical protein
MRDLTSTSAIKLKGILFLLLGLFAASILWLDLPTWRTALLLAITIWAFCRAYYFAFYVLEKYIDPQFKFSGLWSALRYLLSRRH